MTPSKIDSIEKGSGCSASATLGAIDGDEVGESILLDYLFHQVLEFTGLTEAQLNPGR